MFGRVFAALLALGLTACPGPKPPGPPQPRGGSAQPDAGVHVAEPDHAQECDDLVSRALGLYMGELALTKPESQLPTEEEIADLRAELRADPACTQFTPEAYRCAMAAATLAEFSACAP